MLQHNDAADDIRGAEANQSVQIQSHQQCTPNSQSNLCDTGRSKKIGWLLPFAACYGYGFGVGIVVMVCMHEFSRYDISNSLIYLFYCGISQTVLILTSLSTWYTCIPIRRMKRVLMLHVVVGLVFPWIIIGCTMLLNNETETKQLVMWTYRVDWLLTVTCWFVIAALSPLLVKRRSIGSLTTAAANLLQRAVSPVRKNHNNAVSVAPNGGSSTPNAAAHDDSEEKHR